MSTDPFWWRVRSDRAAEDRHDAIARLSWLTSQLDYLVDQGTGKGRRIAVSTLENWREVVGEAVVLLGAGERP
jgi:hypothetical protein